MSLEGADGEINTKLVIQEDLQAMYTGKEIAS